MELRDCLDMPSKFTRLLEASVSQGLVLFISDRRAPLSGLSAECNNVFFEREYAVRSRLV